MAWTEGEKVGGYILGKQLGQGGMATVYMGHHPELDRQVAIKVMHQNFLEDEGFVARFKREAQIVAKLSHPHIVPVYDFAEHDNQPYLVMKYVQGWTLKKQLIKNPPDLDGIVEIMGAISDALTYAHEQGILHRDIKPSNIVIDTDGIPYLTDFGLARLVTSGESTMSADMLLGTPHYISPEQARGSAQLDGRTDIYSLGIVLYELLVGKVPFTGDSAFSIVHDHIYTPLPEPTEVNPELPDSVGDVLIKALAKTPQERYETANELLDNLKQAIEQGHLTELAPDRAVIAEASLAKIRSEYDDQPTITPYIGVGSPMPQGSSVRKAKIYDRPTPFYDQPRFWIVSGCGSLILIVFISFSILLGMSSNLQELTTLSIEREQMLEETRFSALEDTLSPFIASSDYDVTINREMRFPILEVPTIPLNELPEETDNFVISTLIVQSHYANNDFAQAREVAINSLPDEATLRASMLSSIARIASNNDDRLGSIIFSILAADSAKNQPFVADAVFDEATRNIYENAIIEGDDNLLNLLQALLQSNNFDPELLQVIEDSELTRFATARRLIQNGNQRVARNTLAQVSQSTMENPAFLLLRAEVLLLNGDRSGAESILNDILDDNDTTDWVVNRVEAIQNDLE